MKEIRKIAIVGGGLMGAGIAQVFATCGYPVSVYEPSDDARSTLHQRVADNLRLLNADSSVAEEIVVTGDLAEAVGEADFVTEAAPEKLELKRSIFAELVSTTQPSAIITSNTSVIPISRITEGLDTADRMVGT